MREGEPEKGDGINVSMRWNDVSQVKEESSKKKPKKTDGCGVKDMTAAISNVGEKKCRVVAGYLRMKDRERTSAKTFF